MLALAVSNLTLLAANALLVPMFIPSIALAPAALQCILPYASAQHALGLILQTATVPFACKSIPDVCR